MAARQACPSLPRAVSAGQSPQLPSQQCSWDGWLLTGNQVLWRIAQQLKSGTCRVRSRKLDGASQISAVGGRWGCHWGMSALPAGRGEVVQSMPMLRSQAVSESVLLAGSPF